MEAMWVGGEQISKYKRMDAAFHIAVKKISPKAEALSNKIDKKEALNRILPLKTEDLTCLTPLTAGNNKPGRNEFIKAAETYPIIAYALILDNIDALEEGAKKEIAEAEGYRATVRRLRM